jgi:hypothetical protein
MRRVVMRKRARVGITSKATDEDPGCGIAGVDQVSSARCGDSRELFDAREPWDIDRHAGA